MAAAGRRRPDAGRVAVMGVHDELARGLHPLRHRAREALQRRRLGEDRAQRVRVVLRQLVRINGRARTGPGMPGRPGVVVSDGSANASD